VSSWRRTAIGVALFLAGCVVGALMILGWQTVNRSTPATGWQATLFLPTVDNTGRHFTEEEWRTALMLLTREFGGLTHGPEYEGWWQDAQGALHREPVRVLLVTFDRDRLPAFRRTVREVGRRLGQEAMYFRLEEAHVEVLQVREEKSQKGP
jgi:hypothetical protein